jgi:hypothetical protein
MSLHALLLLLFGIGFLISPNGMLNIYDAHTDPVGELASRAFAVNNIILSVAIWIGREHLKSRMATGLIIALFIGNSINGLLAIHGQVSKVLSMLGWINVALYLSFAIGYGTHLYSVLRKVDKLTELIEESDEAV